MLIRAGSSTTRPYVCYSTLLANHITIIFYVYYWNLHVILCHATTHMSVWSNFRKIRGMRLERSNSKGGPALRLSVRCHTYSPSFSVFWIGHAALNPNGMRCAFWLNAFIIVEFRFQYLSTHTLVVRSINGKLVDPHDWGPYNSIWQP